MQRNDGYLYDGHEMGRRTVRLLYAVLVDNPRKLHETQEEYANRIILLVGRQMMEELGLRMRTQD